MSGARFGIRVIISEAVIILFLANHLVFLIHWFFNIFTDSSSLVIGIIILSLGYLSLSILSGIINGKRLWFLSILYPFNLHAVISYYSYVGINFELLYGVDTGSYFLYAIPLIGKIVGVLINLKLIQKGDSFQSRILKVQKIYYKFSYALFVVIFSAAIIVGVYKLITA